MTRPYTFPSSAHASHPTFLHHEGRMPVIGQISDEKEVEHADETSDPERIKVEGRMIWSFCSDGRRLHGASHYINDSGLYHQLTGIKDR